MTIKQVLAKHQNPEIDLLLSAALNKPREFLYLCGETKITKKQHNNLTKFIGRRQKGEPMAYILGYKDFLGLRFKVNKHVLIPRPETEMIVDKVIKACKVYKARTILDVGTGSGCIAIAIAKQSRNYKVVASDVSLPALKTAKENARMHRARVKFVKSDLLKNIKGKFDIIAANLPYVPKEDYGFLIKDLRYEPSQAIFAAEKGLSIIKKFLNQLVNSGICNPEALILLEFDPRQKLLLSKLIKKILPQSKAEFFKDLSRRWRFAEIKIG